LWMLPTVLCQVEGKSENVLDIRGHLLEIFCYC
jgi:hypothetical protein